MKGENYLYIQDDAAEANATNECVMIPASRILGMSPGNSTGVGGATLLMLHWEALSNTGAARGHVRFVITSGKHVEAMDDVVAAMNSTPGDGFVVIADVLNGVFCSPWITGAAITTEE